MPNMPFSIALCGTVILVPLITSIALTWFLYVVDSLEMSVSDVQDILWKANVVLSGVFILIIPSIIAFWSRHPNRWAILLLSFLTGWMVLPYLLLIHWSMGRFTEPDKKDAKEKPRVGQMPPPVPSLGELMKTGDQRREKIRL